jgi:hypothetical protein
MVEVTLTNCEREIFYIYPILPLFPLTNVNSAKNLFDVDNTYLEFVYLKNS